MDLGDALFRAFGVVGPAAAAVLGVYANLLARRGGGVFRDFISREDELEDECLDERQTPKVAPDANGASSERTPLLSTHHREASNRHRRSTQNVLLLIVGFIEFATRLALLVLSVAKTDDAPATDEMLVLKSWAYATFLPLLKPSVTPYYSLLAIYTSNVVASCVKAFLALVPAPQAVIDANPWRLSLLLELGHPVLCLVALSVLLGMPVRETDALPDTGAARPDVEPFNVQRTLHLDCAQTVGLYTCAPCGGSADAPALSFLRPADRSSATPTIYFSWSTCWSQVSCLSPYSISLRLH